MIDLVVAIIKEGNEFCGQLANRAVYDLQFAWWIVGRAAGAIWDELTQKHFRVLNSYTLRSMMNNDSSSPRWSGSHLCLWRRYKWFPPEVIKRRASEQRESWLRSLDYVTPLFILCPVQGRVHCSLNTIWVIAEMSLTHIRSWFKRHFSVKKDILIEAMWID